MPIYEFMCLKCNQKYDYLTSYDESGKYKGVSCPECNSKKKEKLASSCAFNFSNPVGTDRWTSGSTGHDYRFKHNIPNVKKQREMAEAASHVGASPYKEIDDIPLDTGIHDAEFRKGLS